MRRIVVRRALVFTLLGAVAASAVAVGSALVSSGPSSAMVGSVAGGTPPHDAGHEGEPTGADGILPTGGASADDTYPGVANVDVALLAALREATGDAAAEGVSISITSGWRSAHYQESLRRDAVGRYGSAEEAARWVATPDTSLHVAGEAVDIGSYDAMDWLGERGSDYGLCRVYDNEPWHFELRPDAAAQGCPRTYRDATQDPRLQG